LLLSFFSKESKKERKEERKKKRKNLGLLGCCNEQVLFCDSFTRLLFFQKQEEANFYIRLFFHILTFVVRRQEIVRLILVTSFSIVFSVSVVEL
jgi:hypothetical protein